MRSSLSHYSEAKNAIFTQFSQNSSLEKMVEDIQKRLECNAFVTEKQLMYWVGELSSISNEKIKSFYHIMVSLYSPIFLGSGESRRLLSLSQVNTSTLSISIESNRLETVPFDITPYLDQTDLWNVIFNYLCLRERAVTATISKKWRNLLESYPLEGIIPIMWSGNDEAGWIFLNAGMHQYSLREWREQLYGLNNEEKNYLQHMQIMTAYYPLVQQLESSLTDSEADLLESRRLNDELETQDSRLKMLSKLNSKRLTENIILGTFIAMISLIFISKISDNPLLIYLSPIFFSTIISLFRSGSSIYEQYKTAIRCKEIGTEVKVIGERAICTQERLGIILNVEKLLETKPAKDLRGRLDSFTTIHKISDSLREVKKNQLLASQHFIARSSQRKHNENQQEILISRIASFGKGSKED